MNNRPARAHEVQVGLVQLPRFLSQQAGADFDSGCAKMCKAAPGNLWIRIFDRRYDPFDSGCNQCIGAWWSAAVMSVRFERNVSRGASCAFPGLLKGEGLSVLYLLKIVESFADDFAFGNDGATNQRTRARQTDTMGGEFQRAPHQALIKISSLK